jgi:hypothetical protein
MNIMDWFSKKIKKIGFEDIKIAIIRPNQTLATHSLSTEFRRNVTSYKNDSTFIEYILINTLEPNEQDCLIKNTMDIFLEEKKINEIMDHYLFKQYKIIIYGKNSTDESVEKKYNQLVGLGFSEVYIYYGGIFEWMLLQDIYGEEEFPTTSKILDILKYKPLKILIHAD